MHVELKEKINYEFEKFKIEKVRQSKAEIFAASYEIESKKMIRRTLEELETDAATMSYLIAYPYLLDRIYLEMEKSRSYGKKGVEECIGCILKVSFDTER